MPLVPQVTRLQGLKYYDLNYTFFSPRLSPQNTTPDGAVDAVCGGGGGGGGVGG